MVNYSMVDKNKNSGILQNPTCNSNLTPSPPTYQFCDLVKLT